MKKLRKAINVTAISAMAVSGIVAANPHQADAATSAESLVIKAEQNKNILICAISIEYKADIKTQPWAQYNKAKADYNAAKKAVSTGKLSAKDRTRLNARLDAVKVWIDRTAIYIDAITSGRKLAGLQTELEKNMAAANLEGMTQTYYKLSSEMKKQAAYLYKVYGKSTREAIVKKYELPANTAKQKALYPVSVYIEVGRLVSAIEAKNDPLAAKSFNKINKWVQEIDSVAMREALENYYTRQLAPFLEED